MTSSQTLDTAKLSNALQFDECAVHLQFFITFRLMHIVCYQQCNISSSSASVSHPESSCSVHLVVVTILLWGILEVWVIFFFDLFKRTSEPWLAWLSGFSDGLRTKRSRT